MSGEYIVINPIPANLVLRYGNKYALLYPTHRISSPVRSTPRAVEGRMAAAPAKVQSAAPRGAAVQAPPEALADTQGAPAVGAVRLANMTSLYSDKLTDKHNER
jgi:hypothetical protein